MSCRQAIITGIDRFKDGVNETSVGQIVNLLRIVNPPARCGSEPARVSSRCDRRIANPPQVANLPHISARPGATTIAG